MLTEAGHISPLVKVLTKRLGYGPTPEYGFHPDRKWRFDLAFVPVKVAVEIDGATHASLARHRKDCEKRNAATVAGWRVLTYPAKTIRTAGRFQKVVDQICETVCNHISDAGYVYADASDTNVIEG